MLVGGQAGSKTLLHQNPAVLNWWCRLIQLVLSNAVKFFTRYGVTSGQYKSTFISVFVASSLTSGPFLVDVLMPMM